MGHGFLVPVAIGWIVWRERPRWRNLRAEPSRAGFLILAAGAGMQLASALSAGLFAGSVGFVFSLAGAIVCLGGFAWLRVWAFPMLLTLFMLPKLAIVYNQGTLPLQLLATKMAGGMLSARRFQSDPGRKHFGCFGPSRSRWWKRATESATCFPWRSSR